MSTEAKTFEGWAIVEIMGHQTYAGRVSEQIVGGSPFVRVDVPEIPERKLQAFTKLFGGSSIYCITPVSEEVARLRAASICKQPVDVYDLPIEAREAIYAARQKGPALEHKQEVGGESENDDYLDFDGDEDDEDLPL